MSFVFNTNLQRSGIDWRLFSPEYTSQYQSEINNNVGKTLSNSATLISSPFSNASAVSSVLLSNGNVLCSGQEGLYTFNPVSNQFTYKSNNLLNRMQLLDDGNVLGVQFVSNNITIINPNNGSIEKNTDLEIIASDTSYLGLISLSSGPQTFTLNISTDALKYIPGIIVKVQDNIGSNSFTGTITATTQTSITIQKTSQTGSATSDWWTITVVGQTSTALNAFKNSVLNFQKIPIETSGMSFYVLSDSSFERGAYIDPVNWKITFTGGLGSGGKSSSKWSSSNSSSGGISFPSSGYDKIISTRSTGANAMVGGLALRLNHPSGSITNQAINGTDIFCLLPQIDSQSTNQAQGRILLNLVGNVSEIWNTSNNSIQVSSISGSAPDRYTSPVQLLDGRIFLTPMPNASNPSSFVIYGGGGGFNPNITLSPYFNKYY